MSSLNGPAYGAERQWAVMPGVNPRSRVDLVLTALRLRLRTFSRFIESLPLPKRGYGHAFAVSFITAGWLYGAAAGGNGSAVVTGTAAVLGLKSTDILITGQVETTEQQVFQALGVGGSLLGFDAGEARDRVRALPWVKDVAIRKLFPGKLTVAVAEKRPMAVWQLKDRLTVVEQTGATIIKFGITDLLSNKFAHLPHLVGEGAAEAADEILPLAAKFPAIASRVSSYLRIGNRRWDIDLTNGVRIHLPEHKAEKALSHLNELANETRLLEREINVIDMRLSDRITLRLEPVAAKTRLELVTARLKAMKKADRKL